MPKSRYVPTKLKDQVAKRAKYLCEYCKCPKAYAPSPFDTEHIIPISKQGTSDLMNLAFSCNGCNGSKYNKIEALDPVSNQIVPLFNPRKVNWTAHFTWSNDSLLIIGITATGRATIALLQLNRAELVNIRRLLLLVGEHPPTD